MLNLIESEDFIMKKLTLSELKIKSFQTSKIIAGRVADQIENPNEPTPGTFCFHCPPASIEACY